MIFSNKVMIFRKNDDIRTNDDILEHKDVTTYPREPSWPTQQHETTWSPRHRQVTARSVGVSSVND